MTARPPMTVFDEVGRVLTVVGTAEVMMVMVEGANHERSRLHVCELDADTAVQLAHDLLERAASRTDCDETHAALVALRQLAARNERLDAIVRGEDTP